jgi:electron transport complex protein RnfE
MIAEEFHRGIVKENPILVLALGLCPSLAVSTSLLNGIGMGLAVTFVLICSNTMLSLVKRAIPGQIRIPCYILVIAAFVTIVQLLMEAYFPQINRQLGIYVPLIVVNCLILGRAEAFASKNNLPRSVLDGIVMGLGFTLALGVLSAIRELLGTNRLCGLLVFPSFTPMTAMILAPGGFFTIAFVMGIVNYFRMRKERLKT